MTKTSYSFLSLGDSYTIGESLPLFQTFPYQTVQKLRAKGLSFNAPEIIAKTGFTSFELMAQIKYTYLQPQYDFVTLLIGVNNQYRGLSKKEYEAEFATLLEKAITLTGGNAQKVMVLSIPDWGATPFAADRNAETIAQAIDGFNIINQTITQQLGAHYIDITTHSRMAVNDLSLIAADGLHPSAKCYSVWADKVVEVIEESIVKSDS